MLPLFFPTRKQIIFYKAPTDMLPEINLTFGKKKKEKEKDKSLLNLRYMNKPLVSENLKQGQKSRHCPSQIQRSMTES